MNGNAAMIEKLVQAGADANKPLSELGETPLMMASRTGNLEAVKTLLRHKAAVNAKEITRGHTALMWAATEGHTDVVKELVANGADVNARSNAEAAPARGAPERRRGRRVLHQRHHVRPKARRSRNPCLEPQAAPLELRQPAAVASMH